MDLHPDPHGQAALMLCESLILLFVEQGVVDKERILEAVESVIEVKQQIAGVRENVVVSAVSITLLREVARSIAVAAGPIYVPSRE